MRQQCETVLASLDVESESDSKRKQLEVLLNHAKSKEEYFKDRMDYWTAKSKEMEESNTNIVVYRKFKTSMEQAEENLKKAEETYSTDYNNYERKARHVMNLIYNTDTYNILVPKNVVYSSNPLLKSDGAVYNFGLAQAVEKYKYYSTINNTTIAFDTLTAKYNEIMQLLNKNYSIVKPASKKYNSNLEYYFRNDRTGEFEKYSYDGDEKYLEDYKNLYITDYPSLLPLNFYEKYERINTSETFNTSEKYYRLNSDGTYSEASDITGDNYDANKSRLYRYVGNGGIKQFLALLTNGSSYLKDLIDAYKGIMSLYETLEAQKIGGSIMLDKIEKELASIRVQLAQLNQVLELINQDQEFDEAKAIDEILQALAEYLRVLTLSYINNVERSYGVI